MTLTSKQTYVDWLDRQIAEADQQAYCHERTSAGDAWLAAEGAFRQAKMMFLEMFPDEIRDDDLDTLIGRAMKSGWDEE